MSVISSKILMLYFIACSFIANYAIREYNSEEYMTNPDNIVYKKYTVDFKYSIINKSNDVVYILECVNVDATKNIKVDSFVYFTINKGDSYTHKVITHDENFYYVLYFTGVTLVLIVLLRIFGSDKRFTLKLTREN